MRLVHALFISAMTSSISFRLAHQSSIVSLGPDRIVMPSTQRAVAGLRHGCAPATILRVTVYLTSTGHLVISTAPATTPVLFRFSDLHAVASLPPNAPVLLAPTSFAAQFVGSAHGVTSMPSFDSHPYVRWRDCLVRELKGVGIHVSNPEVEASWVAVNIPWPFSNLRAIGLVSSTRASVWWPAHLCFVEQTDLEELEASLRLANASAWFLDPIKGGFLDPVIAAEQWFGGHAERDQKITTRRQRNREQAMTQKQLMASSPISSRNITYGETHGAGGVYPTPPDGLASHHTSGIHPMDASASSFSNGHFFGTSHLAETKDAMSMDLDISSPFETRPIDEKPPVTNDLTTAVEDDLFGDMDEDDFGGNDITDADFSFFDLPDELDVDAQGKSDVDISLNGTNWDHNSSNVDIVMEDKQCPEPPVNKRSPENAHRSGSQADGGAEKDPSDTLLASISDESHADLSRTNQVERLDPLEVKKRLFANGTDSSLLVRANATPKSVFRPLLFSHDLSLVDAKYSAAGQFAVVDPPIPNKKASGVNTGTLAMPSTLRTADRTVATPQIKDLLALPKSIGDRGSDRSDWGSDSDSISDETESTYNQSHVKVPAIGKHITRLEMPPSPLTPRDQQAFETVNQAEMVCLSPES
jgi:mediator of RNA polymerase II transcription subunit 13, fungi type